MCTGQNIAYLTRIIDLEKYMYILALFVQQIDLHRCNGVVSVHSAACALDVYRTPGNARASN